MTSNICVLLVTLVLAGVAPLPIANAQQSFSSVLFNITGEVPCSTGGSVTSSTTVFPKATVELTIAGNVIANTTTNANGLFSLVISLPTSLLASLLSNGRIVITTPLVSCNASLPSTGSLSAPLFGSVLSIIANALGITFNLIPGVFTLV